jgi:dihydrofolate reductase
LRKLIANTFVTLDGVMQAPGGPEEDPADGFAHGGWSVNHWDEDMNRVMGEVMGHPFDLLLGRKTYEIFAGYWPNAGDVPGAKELNDATKYVASRTLDRVDWQNSVLIEGDVPEGVAAIKQQDGPEIQIHGSGNLIQTLLKHSLIDEFHTHTFPVVVGSGKRLFEQGTLPGALKLVESSVSKSGVVTATYVPAGELVTGSFGSE